MAMEQFYWQKVEKVSFAKLKILTDRGFGYVRERITFDDETFKRVDEEIAVYSDVQPAVKPFLAKQSALLASLAISKLEGQNTIGINEARTIFADRERGARRQDTSGAVNRVTAKDDYSRLEYENIVDTLQFVNSEKFIPPSARPHLIHRLSPELIQDLHHRLTDGLDRFDGYVIGFSKYNAGRFRDTDEVVVGLGRFGDHYRPIPSKDIPSELKRLIEFLQHNPTITGVNLFITGLYAIHPFRNGNKRLCRILEHALLRDLGLNKYNIYNPSRYYSNKVNLERFHAALQQTLALRNFTPFVNLSREALFFSQLSVMEYVVAIRRRDFLKEQVRDPDLRDAYKVLAENKAKTYSQVLEHMQRVLKKTSKGSTERSIVTYLKQATKDRVLLRERKGRTALYSLSLQLDEERYLKETIGSNLDHIEYIPADLSKLLYFPGEAPRTSTFSPIRTPSGGF